MMKMKKILSLFLLITIMAGIFTGCATNDNNSFQSMEDFRQAKIGVLTGSSFDLLATEYFPDAEKLYYMNITDLILNLKQDQIDGILMDKGFFTPLQWEKSDFGYVEMDMPATEFAVAFPKTEQ
jgi:polar amino acid transport system substrate-binding protein